MEISNKEFLLIADLLDLAENEFCNHGCNDYDLPDDWTTEDKEKLRKDAIKLGIIDKKDSEEGDIVNGDNLLMMVYSSKLQKIFGNK